MAGDGHRWADLSETDSAAFSRQASPDATEMTLETTLQTRVRRAHLQHGGVVRILRRPGNRQRSIEVPQGQKFLTYVLHVVSASVLCT